MNVFSAMGKRPQLVLLVAVLVAAAASSCMPGSTVCCRQVIFPSSHGQCNPIKLPPETNHTLRGQCRHKHTRQSPKKEARKHVNTTGQAQSRHKQAEHNHVHTTQPQAEQTKTDTYSIPVDKQAQLTREARRAAYALVCVQWSHTPCQRMY